LYKVINLKYIKMRGLNIKNQSKKNKKELSQQEQNILDATKMKNMSPVFKNSSSGRDTPLAPTPEPQPVSSGMQAAPQRVATKYEQTANNAIQQIDIMAQIKTAKKAQAAQPQGPPQQ
jgi:hypothetical protein